MSAPVPRPAGPFVPAGSVRIFDTTLRDGEQAPGAGLTAAEKLEVARQLARLKVDVIEAGFPAASPGDFEAVRRIAQETPQDIAVAALARCKDGDPQRAIEAIKVAHKPHLHVFIATSDIHLKHKLRVDRETALRRGGPLGPLRARAARPRRRDRVQRRGRLAHRHRLPAAGLRGRRRGGRVDRQHPRHGRLRDPGRVRGADARGSSTSSATRRPSASTATTTWARDGQHARRGPGRRAPGRGHDQRPRRARRQRVARGGRDGPPHATDAVPGDRLRRPDRAHHRGLAARVSYLTGFAVQPNKAIVGGNAFAHESGIHQDGVIKHPLTYEIMTPQSVGLSGSQLTIGKLSGRRGLQGKLRELGHELEGDALDVDLSPGDRAGRREEGGHRRRPAGARRAARVRGPGERRRSSAGA